MKEKVLRFTFALQSDLPDDDAHCETMCKKDRQILFAYVKIGVFV